MTNQERATENKMPLTISVIMPVYNGIEFIKQSLPPLVAMRDRGEVAGLVVSDIVGDIIGDIVGEIV